MNLLSIAGRMAAPDRPPIMLDTKRCVHAHNRFSKCDACITSCPVGALQLSKTIELNEQACIACAACLPVCPVGALSGDDGAKDLGHCISRLPQKEVIELVCAQHTAADSGPAGTSAAIRTDGCLASFGPSVYAWLLASGTTQVIVRLDACASCSLGKVQPQITRTLASVSQLTVANDATKRVLALEASRADWKPRPLITTKNPPLSRRDLFRALVSEGPKLAAQILPFEENSATEAKTPPLERRRLLNALKRLGADGVSIASENDLGVVKLSANEKCTACGACARVCPTGALRFVSQGDNFRLTIVPSACTDCGACLALCAPAALQRNGVPSFAELTASEPMVLRADALRVCVKCGAKYAGETAGDLCSICRFRLENPFGSRLPTRVA